MCSKARHGLVSMATTPCPLIPTIKILQDKTKLEQLQRIIPLMVGNIEETKQFVVRLAGLEPTCIH